MRGISGRTEGEPKEERQTSRRSVPYVMCVRPVEWRDAHVVVGTLFPYGST